MTYRWIDFSWFFFGLGVQKNSLQEEEEVVVVGCMQIEVESISIVCIMNPSRQLISTI